ncbi:TetR/AcrR family transcriptional regulator [Gryllotalpicola ginsengisoli]|uniref:TetR/AcrR family transcriptional regulator n=1 Tax=Gryllotalpicola ginsengisoli TaxID=444608 RepID=UPI0003B4627B|nr:TetR/AcrR family transcriptional regulator [Gryllotalpicola ginsengisoli]
MEDVPGRVGRRAVNAARKESAIRRAAIELCEQHGYPAVSMAQIAAGSGVAERTVFRTFGSKAGIFWKDAFLGRVVQHLDPDAGVRDPLAATLRATEAAARALRAEDRELEARRRAVILAEPELRGAGALALGSSIADLAELLTPPHATTDQKRRVDLFALFAAMAIAYEPLTPERQVDDWVSRLREALTLAAKGPLA